MFQASYTCKIKNLFVYSSESVGIGIEDTWVVWKLELRLNPLRNLEGENHLGVRQTSEAIKNQPEMGSLLCI